MGCNYQTHLGRVWPCYVRILDPKRKIIVLSHPYLEGYVVLPTRSHVRSTKDVIRRTEASLVGAPPSEPSAITLGEALGVSADSLVQNVRFPNQPYLGGSPQKILTCWWGVTLCPPEMNDLALAAYVVCEMRMAAVQEMADIGQVIAAVPESTPNEEATIYESTFGGAKQIAKYAAPVSTDSASRVTRSLRATGVHARSTSPWSRAEP